MRNAFVLSYSRSSRTCVGQEESSFFSFFLLPAGGSDFIHHFSSSRLPALFSSTQRLPCPFLDLKARLLGFSKRKIISLGPQGSPYSLLWHAGTILKNIHGSAIASKKCVFCAWDVHRLPKIKCFLLHEVYYQGRGLYV